MEKLHFKVESPANFVKLACTILFERKEELLDDYGSTWHDVFDGEAGNQHFQRFMEELFPDGCTIGERELNQLTDKAIQFLKTDVFCLDIKAGHDKLRSAFWVYFIPEHKVYPCQFAQHEETVIDILVDFFGVNVQKYSIEALQRFILGAFQIQSTNTSVRSIAADAEFIRRTVYYRADGLRKAGK